MGAADNTLPHLADVRKLKPYERNARTHSSEQKEQLRASFRKFGFVGVIAYNGETIRIGHGRTDVAMAMWEAGEDVWGPGRRAKLPKWQLPAVDVSGLSEDELRALVIADNKLALNADWDEDILRAELTALQDINFEMPAIGFDLSELDKLFDGNRGGAKDPDQIPEPPAQPTSRRGDTWIMVRSLPKCPKCGGQAQLRSRPRKP